MTKNIAIVILILLCVAEGGYIFLHSKQQTVRRSMTARKIYPTSTAAKRPAFLTPGTKFADNPLFAKAYKIFPGDLSDNAKQALNGWDLKQTAMSDGSTQVSLIPHEAEDIQQTFIVKPGYSLYFIEMTLVDDKTGKDMNRGDDMGVLVDQNGVIQ